MNKFSLFRIIAKISSFFLLLAFSFTSTQSVNAQETSPISLEIEYGFSQSCKTNHWLPIWITIQNEGEDFSGAVEFSPSQEASYRLPISLPANGQKEYHTQIYIDNSTSQNLLVKLTDDKNKSITTFRKKTNCTSSPIIGVVSSTPSAFTILNAPILKNIQNHETTFISIDRIPNSALSLRAIDYLVISNVDTTRLTEEQQQAISIWVSQGGQLILSAGSSWQTNLAGFESLLPIQINGSTTTSIENGFQLLDIDFSLSDIVISTGNLNTKAEVLYENQGLPLVVQQKFGTGSTTLITFDPNHPTFRSWSKLDAFYSTLLNYKTSSSYNYPNQFQDWRAGQNAATAFPNLNIPSLWLICGILIFYIILLGPGTYIVLGYLNKREWAWVTTPGFIVLFSLAFILVGAGFRGNRPLSNHLAVVQFSAEDEFANAKGIYGVFSPTRRNYNFDISAGFSPHSLPDVNSYSNSLNTEWEFSKTQDYTAATRIDTAGFATFGVQGFISAPKIEIESHLEVRSGTLYLVGRVQNNTEIALIDCALVYPDGVFKLGLLSPGEKEDVDIPLNLTLSSMPGGNRSSYGYGGIAIEQLLGNSYYSDPDLNRRADLLQALFGYYEIPTIGAMSFFFIGWDDTQTPFQINISEYESNDEYLTAYIIPLDSTITTDSEVFEIPAFFFNWEILGESAISSYETPYDLSMSNNEVVEINYQLETDTAYSEILNLSLHLDANYDEQVFPAEISIWNFTTNQWDILDIKYLGTHTLPPASHISHGNIRLKIHNQSTENFSYLHFSQIDFTITVEP